MTTEEKGELLMDVQDLADGGGAISGDMLYDLEMDEIPMLLEPILPKVGIVGFFGSSDTGKSAFLRQLSIAISGGMTEFLGFKLNAEHKKAIYVSTEDDYYATSKFIRKQSKYNRDHVKNIRFIFDTRKLVDTLEDQLLDQVDLVVIDAYSDVFRGDMNQATSVRSFLNDFSEMANRHRCLIVFLHHSGKGRQNYAPGKDNILGSQGFESKMRLIAEFRTDPIDDNLRHLCIVKGNYLTAEDKSKSFALRFEKDMIFSNAGIRIPFGDLTPIEPRGAINNSDIINQVMRLSKDGLSTRKIEEELLKLGTQLGKSSVNRIVKENSETFDFSKSWVPPKDKPEKVDDDEEQQAGILA